MSGHPILPAEPITLPLLPLRDVVVFPHMVIPLFVGRPKSIKALEAAMEAGKSIMLVAPKNGSKDAPTASDIYGIGCVSNILQLLKLPDSTVKVLVVSMYPEEQYAIRAMRAVPGALVGAGTVLDPDMLDAVIDYLPSPVDVPAIDGFKPGDESVKIERHPDSSDPFAAQRTPAMLMPASSSSEPATRAKSSGGPT